MKVSHNGVLRLLGTVGAALLLLVPMPSAAQTAVGDSLWRIGRINEARVAYERAVQEDRQSVRANFRLAQALAWESNIDSALVLLRVARQRVPDDPDLLVSEATYLAWGRRFDQALVRYDSVSAEHPDAAFDYVRVARARTLSWAGRFRDARAGFEDVLRRTPSDRDAQFGLAQLRAWSGDLVGAARGYTTLLADDPTEPRVLLGLASVRHWQGRSGTAMRLLQRAAVVAPNDVDAASMRAAIQTQRAPQMVVTQQQSTDSDGNVNAWTTSTARLSVGDLQAGLTLGSLTAADAAREARRRLAEGNLRMPVGPITLAGALGVRFIDPAWRPDIASGNASFQTRQVLAWRASAAVPVSARVTATLGVAAWPIDDVASLLERSLDANRQDVALTWRPFRRLTVTTAIDRTAYSDRNERTGATVHVSYPLAHGFALGAFGTGFGFAERSPSYFSPSMFRAASASASWAREALTWSASLSGGLGAQQVNRGQPLQSQWHVEVRATRQLIGPLAIEASAGRNTSAAASVVGAYRYDHVGLGLRVRPQ